MMRLLFGLMALLLAGALGAKEPDSPRREWLIIFQSQEIVIGVDAKSFEVVRPLDAFTFDMVLIGNLGTIGGRAVAGAISTVKVSCATREARILRDTAYDARGDVIDHDFMARADQMGPFDAASPIGLVAASICAGQGPARGRL